MQKALCLKHGEGLFALFPDEARKTLAFFSVLYNF
jgi:hypothetical protein